MTVQPDWPAWLEKLEWRDAWMTLEAAEPAVLPPYLGSTLRGALGHLLRSALCDGAGCGHDCQRPDACRYYSLFEKNRTADGQSVPKSFVLMAPSLPGLEEIAEGGPVSLPYRTGSPRGGESIPTLRCEASWKFDPRGTLRFGLRLFGVAAKVLPGILQGVARYGLVVRTSRFHLISAHDHLGQTLYDRRQPNVPAQMPPLQRFAIEPETAQRVRILFLLPGVYKPRSEKSPTFAAQVLAAGLVERCIGRAKEMYQSCCAGGKTVPWVATPAFECVLEGHRLFHYELPRHSFRQEKSPDYDGVIGYLDLRGQLDSVMPWVRAAEVLHFGERSTSGLGKIRALVLE